MEELLKHRLSFDQLCDLVRQKKPFVVHYVAQTQPGQKSFILVWAFDENSFVKDHLIEGTRLGKLFLPDRFPLRKFTWDIPKEDAGFLNYFHAYGYCQLVRARQRKEVAV